MGAWILSTGRDPNRGRKAAGRASAAFLMAATLLCLAVSVHAFQAGDLFRQGFERMNARDFTAAESSFRQAIALEPNNADLHMFLGMALDQQNRLTEAAASYQKAVSLRPGNFRTLTNLGLNLFKQKKTAQAIEALQASVKLSPNQFAAQYILGLSYFQSKQYTQAITALEAADRLKPGDPQVTTPLEQARRLAAPPAPQRAAALVEAGRFAEALPMLEALRRQNPVSEEAAYNLAFAYFRAGKPSAARPVLESIPRPGAETHALLGNVYRAEGKFPQAVDALGKAVAAAPANPDFVYDLAVLQLALDRIDDANRLLDAALKRFPRAGKIHAARGIGLFMTGRNDEALRAYETAIGLEPNAADFHAGLGDVLTATGEAARAAKEYATAIRLDPGTADYHLKSGRNLLKLQQDPPAAAAFRKAISLDASLGEAHFQLGKLAAGGGDHAAAIRHFEKAIECDPNAADAWYQLSLSYQRAGNREKAAAALQRFRDLRARDSKK
ncbi:MAG: tetratricopeptide repeat protein [Bryobacteraceae bacterium]